MQTKLKQRVVGAGVLVLFLLPTLIMVIFHQRSHTTSANSQSVALVQQPVNQPTDIKPVTVHTVQLQLPANAPNSQHAQTTSSSVSASGQGQASAAVSSPAVSARVNSTETIPTQQSVKSIQTASVSSSAVGDASQSTPAIQTVNTIAASNKSISPNPAVGSSARINDTPARIVSQRIKDKAAVARQQVRAADNLAQAPVSSQTVQMQPVDRGLTKVSSITPSKPKVMMKSVSAVSQRQVAVAQATVATSQARKKLLKSSLVGVSMQSAWVVQVASFSQKTNAKMLLSKLRHAGFHAYSRQQNLLSGKTVNQVFVGPEVQFNKMQSIQVQLKKRFKLNGLIRQYKI